MKWYGILRFASCTRTSFSLTSEKFFKSSTDIVIPWGQCFRKDVSFHGKKCFTWHSARPCAHAASIVGWMLLSTSSISAKLSLASSTVSEVTSILSEIRWQPFCLRKSMELTTGRFWSSLTVLQLCTICRGKTYSKVLQDWVQEIRHCSAFGSTWQAIKTFSWLLFGHNVTPRFCKNPMCWTLSCSKLCSHAAASNSQALLGHVKTKWTEVSFSMQWSTNFPST